MRDVNEIEGVNRGLTIRIYLGGYSTLAYEGESVASVLFRSRITACSATPLEGLERGYYCGMGICYECVVQVKGVGEVRACRTVVAKDMEVWVQS